MSSELSPGRRPRLSLENFDPSNAAEPILNSPRSIEACRRAGILAKDLVFRYADSFGDKFVSEEIKAMRARHYEEMRVMKLKMVKDEFLKARARHLFILELYSYYVQICSEGGGPSGDGTSRAVNFDKSTAMEREQRAIDAMRARRQAELDQMVAPTSPVCARARGMRTDVVCSCRSLTR